MRKLILVLLLLCGCTPTVLPPVEPQWTQYAPLRNVGDLGPVITDVESHLAAGHPYRSDDRINWVHEGTHGIAGQLRNRYHQPGFYVLRNQVVLMREPATTLSAVAATVPVSLRGRGYNLYLVQQQTYFQRQPTYVFDEWVAYTNGTKARQCLKLIFGYSTIESMMEFVPYALCVPKAANSHDPQIRAFLLWHIERVLALHRDSGVRDDTLVHLRTAADADNLRQFIRTYFGPIWTLHTLGF